ncbi:MAG: hypothetical protein SAJ12_18555 [Jaaginema sp. PMC 1079.18]|nr:hypothetical protein [Jaaginema sp. PMC 1080.18]MEC4852987.1 hypothetical protein [Jaaginema sp. PMC 1079.18]MEC4865964.1 hypothetical protein [Jaaginema sp. PMC 1078.18]
MRLRRRRRISSPTQNLDSFLDILTNTVGVLMFIGLFVALITVEVETIVRTPEVSNTNKNAQFFEVTNDEIKYLDTDQVSRQLDLYMEGLPPCRKPEIPDTVFPEMYDYYLSQAEEYQRCETRRIERLQNYRTTTRYYDARVSGGGIAYVPLPQIAGEKPGEIQAATSDFRAVLNKLNPQTDYLAFLVRPDSFTGFRKARELAWEQGFEVGWEPMESDRAIVFGSQGRSVGVQ